jgi:hypothetical protein
MEPAQPTREQVREFGRLAERVLNTDRLDRAELSRLETQLAGLIDSLQACIDDAAHRSGPTTNVRLAGTALRAVKESAQWARMYRKHAPLQQRRERLQMGVQGALGVVRSLDTGDARPITTRGGSSPFAAPT